MYPSVEFNPDFIVSSAAGEKQLLVEVKKWLPLPIQSGLAAWIAKERRRLALPESYVLLVTPEKMTLWPPPSTSAARSATYSVPARDVLAAYLSVERYPLASLNEQELSSVVSAWLGSVMFKPKATLLENPAQAWLVQSGLHSAIYRGFIRRQTAVSQ